MPRPLLALLISCFILGGMTSFMHFRPRPTAYASEHPAPTQVGLRVELQCTGSLSPDTFASEPISMELTLNGKRVYASEQAIAADELIVVDPLPPLTTGKNEFMAQLNFAEESSEQSQAVRIQFFQDGTLWGQPSLTWCEPGAGTAQAVVLLSPDEPLASQHLH